MLSVISFLKSPLVRTTFTGFFQSQSLIKDYFTTNLWLMFLNSHFKEPLLHHCQLLSSACTSQSHFSGQCTFRQYFLTFKNGLYKLYNTLKANAVCVFPFYSCLAWNLWKCYTLWKWMAFIFDLVFCSVSASCFGLMTITVKRKCICASPLSSSCLFLWPFEIDTPCSTLHFAAQCRWWWWWCIYSGSCEWRNTLILSHTVTWFYCLISMSLKLCQSLRLRPSFFLLSTLFSLHHSASPPPFICSLYINSLFLCISHSSLTLSHFLILPPSLYLSLSLSLLFW